MTREEQDRREEELMEWSPGEMARHIVQLEGMLQEAETHLGGYMGSRFAEVEDLRRRIREAIE